MPVTYPPNLKSPTPPITEIFEVAKYRKWDGLGGWGHTRSSSMSLFDRAQTTSYVSLVETMRLSCNVLEI